jgi:hypothetical protein
LTPFRFWRAGSLVDGSLARVWKATVGGKSRRDAAVQYSKGHQYAYTKKLYRIGSWPAYEAMLRREGDQVRVRKLRKPRDRRVASVWQAECRTPQRSLEGCRSRAGEGAFLNPPAGAARSSRTHFGTRAVAWRRGRAWVPHVRRPRRSGEGVLRVGAIPDAHRSAVRRRHRREASPPHRGNRSALQRPRGVRGNGRYGSAPNVEPCTHASRADFLNRCGPSGVLSLFPARSGRVPAASEEFAPLDASHSAPAF